MAKEEKCIAGCKGLFGPYPDSASVARSSTADGNPNSVSQRRPCASFVVCGGKLEVVVVLTIFSKSQVGKQM